MFNTVFNHSMVFSIMVVMLGHGCLAGDFAIDTRLHYAAERGDLAMLQELVLAGANVNERNKGRRTPLHCAATWGQLSAAQFLMDQGADVNAIDMDNNTALHDAVTASYFLPIIQFLVEHGVHVNAKNKFGCTALHSALLAGFSSGAEYLLGKGATIAAAFPARPDDRINNQGFLESLVGVTEAEKLIAFCANPAGQNLTNFTEEQLSAWLRYAALAGSEAGVKTLLAAGASLARSPRSRSMYRLSPRAYGVLGGLLDETIALIPYDHDDLLVYSLKTKHRPVLEKNRSMTLAVLTMLAIRVATLST